MRGGISVVYDLSTVMFSTSEFGHCTKERVEKKNAKAIRGNLALKSVALALH